MSTWAFFFAAALGVAGAAFGCAGVAATLPREAAEAGPPPARTDAATDAAAADADPTVSRAGPAPVLERPDAASDDAGPKCRDARRTGWSSSQRGCGSKLEYRCGNVRYVVTCASDPRGGANCACTQNGQPVDTVVERGQRCGDTEGARELCGLPAPR